MARDSSFGQTDIISSFLRCSSLCRCHNAAQGRQTVAVAQTQGRSRAFDVSRDSRRTRHIATASGVERRRSTRDPIAILLSEIISIPTDSLSPEFDGGERSHDSQTTRFATFCSDSGDAADGFARHRRHGGGQHHRRIDDGVRGRDGSLGSRQRTQRARRGRHAEARTFLLRRRTRRRLRRGKCRTRDQRNLRRGGRRRRARGYPIPEPPKSRRLPKIPSPRTRPSSLCLTKTPRGPRPGGSALVAARREYKRPPSSYTRAHAIPPDLSRSRPRCCTILVPSNRSCATTYSSSRVRSLSASPPPSPGTEASRPIERVESPSRSEPPVSPPAPPLPSPPFPRGTPRSPFLFTPPHALRGGTAGAHETQSHDA